MTSTEVIIAIVGFIVLLTGVFNISFRSNRMLKQLIGETGYRVLMVVLGIIFMFAAIFTDYFA